MPAPQVQPGLEVTRLEPQREVLLRHRPFIRDGATRDVRPEVRDLLQVGRPILNVRREDRADLLVLPHIGIEVPKQINQSRSAAHPDEQRVRRDRGKRRLHTNRNESSFAGKSLANPGLPVPGAVFLSHA